MYPCITLGCACSWGLYLKLSNIVLQEKGDPLYSVIDLLTYLNQAACSFLLRGSLHSPLALQAVLVPNECCSQEYHSCTASCFMVDCGILRRRSSLEPEETNKIFWSSALKYQHFGESRDSLGLLELGQLSRRKKLHLFIWYKAFN